MSVRDLLVLAGGALHGHRLRTALSMTGIAIGISAVILLTSIGEGTRLYVIDQFTQFGTNLLVINPGKNETIGIPGIFGGTTQKLTLEDMESIARIPGVDAVAPVVLGSARVKANGRGRSVQVTGTTGEFFPLLNLVVRQGSLLPTGDPRHAPAVAVIGTTVKRELFGDMSALGEFVRVGGQRFRVVGVMAPKGVVLGLDFDDFAWIPVVRAMKLFNADELWEIDVKFSHAYLEAGLAEDVRTLLTARHGGREDFTIMTQAQMLEVFDTVLNILTVGVSAIAAISLLVGSIGILTVMWIAVGERTSEIGLLKATGATQGQIQLVFLAESAALATFGGAAGIAIGMSIAAVLRVAVPGLPVHTPLLFVAVGLGTSMITGILSGVLPARRAAGLDPVEALRTE